MITVKFVGGAKKSFSTEQLQIDESDISIQELIDIYEKIIESDTFNPNKSKIFQDHLIYCIVFALLCYHFFFGLNRKVISGF